MIQYLIPIVFLIILSILDVVTYRKKHGYIPSVLTTSFIIISLVIVMEEGILTGIFGLLIGMLLVDLDMFKGVADWKIIVACSIVLPTIYSVLSFGLAITLFSIPFKYLSKKTKQKEVPFIPILLVSYVVALVMFL